VIELVHLVGLVGLTIIVTKSTLFARVRRLVSFFACAQCLGWHMGFWATVLSFENLGAVQPWTVIGSRFWYAVLVGGVVSLAASLSEAALAALDEVILKLSGTPGATP
jgi:hypothetical protein